MTSPRFPLAMLHPAELCGGSPPPVVSPRCWLTIAGQSVKREAGVRRYLAVVWLVGALQPPSSGPARGRLVRARRSIHLGEDRQVGQPRQSGANTKRDRREVRSDD